MRKNLKVRFINKNKVTDGYVYVDGKDFGFEDLVIAPVIEVGDTPVGMAVMRLTEEMLKEMEMTTEEAVITGIMNMDYKIVDMCEVIIDMAIKDGMPEELARAVFGLESGMYVISTENGVCGAAAVLTAKAELEQMFPEGYIILPSSIHEMIAVSAEGKNIDDMKDMVENINGNVVAEEDRLTDNAYIFIA